MTVLSSNGLLLGRQLFEVAPFLDWIALPLDGPSSRSNAAMRNGNPKHFEIVVGLLSRIRRDFPTLKFKLGTVVTSENYVDVPQIIGSVGQAALPDVWKIYQISPSNYGRDNYNWLAVTDEVFEETIKKARRASAKYGIPCIVHRNKERDKKYLFIDPTGDALVIERCDEVCVGNIFTSARAVLERWPSYIDEGRLIRNIRKTYQTGGRHLD